MAESKHIQRIVLIDDSEEDRARVRSALMQGAPTRRYRFIEATNGDEGLEICRRSSDGEMPDCVILDLHTSGKSGIDILRELQDALRCDRQRAAVDPVADRDIGRAI